MLRHPRFRLSGRTRLLLPLVLTLAACGEEPTDPERTTPTPDPEQLAQPFEPGTFAIVQVLSQKVAKLIGSGFDTQTLVGYKIVRLEKGETPDTMTYTETKFCYQDVGEASGTCSILSPGTYTHAEEKSFTAQATYEGAEPGEQVVIGARFQIPLQVSLQGVELEDPLYDPLPTDIDDPRLIDSDRDGHPGFTLTISGFISGDVWGSERITFGCDGLIIDADHISGAIFGRSDEPPDHVDYYEEYEGRVVEDVFFYGDSSLIPIDTQIEPDPTASRNYFELARVPDDFTCADFKAQASSLFSVPRSTCFDWQ